MYKNSIQITYSVITFKEVFIIKGLFLNKVNRESTKSAGM